MHRSGSQISRGVLCNVADVDLHSYLSLKHGRSCRCPSLVVESEGQWRKHTMLKIRNLKPEKMKAMAKVTKAAGWSVFSPKGNSVLYFRSLPLNYIQNLWFFPHVILTPKSQNILCTKAHYFANAWLDICICQPTWQHCFFKKIHQYVSYRKEGLNQISFNGR